MIERLVEVVRTHNPRPLMALLVLLRTVLEWLIPGRRRTAIESMRLFRPDADARELRRLAWRHLRFANFRSEVRYRPGDLVRQRVEGLEHLHAAQADGRATILTFLHHGYYAGAYASLANAGVPQTIVVSEESMAERPPLWLRHHIKMAGSGPGITFVGVGIGFRGMVSVLESGATLTMACDVPGRHRVEFLGRSWSGTTSIAGLALRTNSRIVPVTSAVVDGEPVVVVNPALDPADHADADALTTALLEVLAPSAVAWPDGYDVPLQMWQPWQEPTPA